MNFLHRAIPGLRKVLRTIWAVIWRACVKYDETDAEQRAASFAYYAFFALFPLIVLLITVATTFVSDKQLVITNITRYITQYIPALPEDEIEVTIRGVLRSRSSASFVAIAVLAWTAVRFFHALVRGVNRAWGTREYTWWRLPIKNLFMTAILASALLIGILVPLILKQIETFYWRHSWEVGLDFRFAGNIFNVARFLVPPLVLFYGFLMFYKFAPRQRRLFREVWIAALFVTLGMDILQRLFTLYTRNVTNFNALYGTFGSVIALLLWIYLVGSVIIFGACLSAAQYEIKMSLADQSESMWAR